jgi:negative regulator of genetic competence, sporulation and motility
MPPKKKATQAGPGMVAISCPACQSKVTCDGSTLVTRSKYLEEIIDKAAGLDEIDKAADALEKQNDELKARVAQLEAELKNEKEKETARNVESAKKSGESKRDGWW